ncbi:hypothetical protein BU24DRAFT_405156 [Aaosphaeria arxii CBS 175.79]|uniref:Uncharacterized protein n=1 Tax=Aaosphaeria arxii CBS 175.79 TaxID=1450172 RepID=A0A6A5YAL2_9PLEO|nr:uncharacterized protein BU24DRAFT_405156 [Aaosphaeria arxii CBS 175.79]KAF2022276.1 hypothetical protein BU24DRAFT_405156 [Aaosphaeria arxii CBS 175.79]
MPRRLRREDYTVGWVCALHIELAAARAMLDEEHEYAALETSDSEDNVYCFGSVAGHNVVIGCLPAGRIGTNSAATVATQMCAAFKGIRFGLMVGIGGGVPSAEADIRLGDVVVSQPEWRFGGVVQYDFGRRTPSGLERIGSLNAPPQILLSAVTGIRANKTLGRSTLSDYLSELERYPDFQRLKAGPDLLFKAAYNHVRGDTCDQCSVEARQPRQERESGAEVTVHYGTIASGNQVMKDAAERDRVSAELGGVLCFEMEAAGLMNSFPCLVIRGISDYADSHKNYKWQEYASGTAAAYAKELLSAIPPPTVMKGSRVVDAMRNGDKRCLPPASPDQAPNKRTKTSRSGSPQSSSAMQRTVPIHPQEASQPSRTLLNAEQRQNLLESLRFDQIDARQMTIKTAHAKTCQWLLKCKEYVSWLDTTKLEEHHGFLWIKGKAGTGKSTLMKYALVNARKIMKDHIVLSFFFNARGEEIEKSTTGTYRSLLLQLLEHLPALHSVFDSLGLSTSKLTADHQWNIETLKMLLEEAIQSLENSSAVCFIDALDECEEEQVRDMIQFFERIVELAVSNGIRFQVCFSSRHYPHVTIRHGLELVLEGQKGHSQDISNYVETELKIGKSKIEQQVRVELQEKASGIFMWVVLVVGILNKESDRGKVHTLRQKLREIPGDLHKLFRNILTRDSHDKAELVLCIQWVLFAKQPLSPEQLYHAIYAGTDPEAIAKWDPEEISKDVIERFLLNSSKGLAEVIESKVQRVQFIHESVRDFLLKENGLGKVWPEYGSNFHGQSHERLKQCCLDYISIDVATPLQIPDRLPKASLPQAVDLRESATEMFPFFEYAVHNVLYHADTAEGGGMSQADFLDSFPLIRWVKLDNVFEKHEVRRHTERVSLLYLLAELDMANLIRVLGSASCCMDVEAERYGSPLFAAAATSSEKAVVAFLEAIEVPQADSNPVAAEGEQQSTRKSGQRTARRDFKYSKAKDYLLNAAELGHDGILALLIRLGRFRLDSKDSRDRTVLWWASKNGCETSVRLLLTADPAMVHSKSKDGKTPLSVAIEQGHQEVIEVLLEGNSDIDASARHGNALYTASASGSKEIAILLLDKGANVNAQGGHYGNALQAALAKGYIAMLLLDKGADVNAQGGFYGNALQAALAKGYNDIVMLLRDKGALRAASAGSHTDIETLLREHGASRSSR